MRSRVLWFVAGSAAAVYATSKARRAAYRLSMPGLVDQAAALGLGWRAFGAEVRDGMAAHEREIVRTFAAADRYDTLALDSYLPGQPASDKDPH